MYSVRVFRRKAFPARLTYVRLPSVSPKVLLKVGFPRSTIITLRARKWLLARVSPLVLGEEPSLLEPFTAVWARERKFGNVSFLVDDQVRILYKAFPTRRTQKRFLPNVDLHVTEESALPREGFLAFGAHKHILSRVGLEMRREV